jgi:hypothetical protein
VPQTRTAPAPPAPAGTPRPLIAGQVSGEALTASDVEAFRIKLNDLREELQDAASRRNSIAERLPRADEGARQGMLDRLRVLDDRIVSLEREITVTGQQLTNAPHSALVAARGQSPDPAQIAQQITGDIVPIVAIVTVFFLAPIAFAISRLIWKRATAPSRPAVTDQATQQRLEQIQQSVDTIAIEVERISEGQRFVTKLLNERERPALGAPGERR